MPNTASPAASLSTPGPRRTTMPERSAPRVSGSGWGRALLPDRTQSSHVPTPAARTSINTSSRPGSGTGMRARRMAWMPPKASMRAASMSDGREKLAFIRELLKNGRRLLGSPAARSLHRIRGGNDDIGDRLWLRQHDDVAAFDLRDGGMDAGRHRG